MEKRKKKGQKEWTGVAWYPYVVEKKNYRSHRASQ
jgi:hypothetical protein